MITRAELEVFFTSHNYEWSDYGGVIRLYSKDSKSFMYLRTKRRYMKLYLFLFFMVHKDFFRMHWRISWHMLQIQIHLNKISSSKTKL